MAHNNGELQARKLISVDQAVLLPANVDLGAETTVFRDTNGGNTSS
jgi:hypothetical protein